MRKNISNKLCFILTPIFILFSNIFLSFSETPNLILVKESQRINVKQVLQKNDINKDTLKSHPTFFTNRNTLNPLQSKSIIKPNGKSISEIEIYPGGNSLGIKLNTNGVLVVAYSQIENESENIPSISEKGGIEIGDNILKINNVEINTAEDMVKAINNCEGKEISLIINRKGNIIEKSITPVKGKGGRYKIGLWIRDSTSGVGTLTFYDDTTKKFAALGHPVTDEDTGNIMTIKSGEIIKASIVSVKRGEKGSPGELKGNFIEETLPLGNIINNTECGIFGEVSDSIKGLKFNKPLKIASKEELKEGPAEIITTIDDSGPKRYKIEIEKLLYQDKPGPKSMVIKVTDKELLEKTGGIVQGMSGSPIIQNNKLVGAVTHVLINKPDTGYGIYIEWMLKDSGILD
ncbi:SpoIVB peptidase [Clostridium algidicarnis]|uniref:SpoIVB peptidase n=1 Tax=Clostridium algidicarnis TaxID=37659 RepID=UPI001628E614|nr:SpoIVB peptidase [Clostridium algidicarnis]MBB6697590.1 SpoIVB peptidase [Clostridium algidicarnis]MBU3203322.1 SpoIVB peptidase [Clostridium algidicarnis]MBU3211476.1 SpoIVB peptidase [Clostridium algidicarnis]MBU3222016.1 SpoIVB peptidase [Clostridium algidicarnis]